MTMKRSISTLLAVAALTVTALSPANAQFGGLGSLGGLVDKAKTAKKVGDAVRTIGEEEEIRMGGELAGIVLGAAPLVANPAQQRYVNRLGTWLALHSERPNLPWKFGIIDTDDVNAFSTPGGHVLISSGLIAQMRNEAELAGVLAHEIAHVVRKHHLAALQKSMGAGALTDVGKSYAASHGGIAGQAGAALLEGGKEIFIKGLDKNDEYEADRMGVVIAARSGYSPYGLVGVLQTLSAAPTDGGFALLFKTHPTPASRIERLDQVMGTRLDAVPGLVDDLPGFVQLRDPQTRTAQAK
jgi:beta-barrel assembly-enhancing protease